MLDFDCNEVFGEKSGYKDFPDQCAEACNPKRLGWMQRQRYWVERTFEDAKSECGMADYQVRKWSAWHHHMAIVMMGMLFMLSERIYHKDIYPLLSHADIE